MQREIDDMRAALTAYIEATYHLSHPKVVAIRRALLGRAGGVSQEPYVESTPTYVGDRKFADLALSSPVKMLMSDLAKVGLLFDPAYLHQAQALEHVLGPDAGGTGLVVTTGTGSGKTESFLLPVLARLADEASARPDHFQTRAVRALLLYPMNALVNDQLGRLRTLFGDEVIRAWFEDKAKRPAKFGRYTGRTLYPGTRDGDRDKKRLASLSYYLELEDAARNGDGEAIDLVDTLKTKGRWPAKPDSTAGAYDGLRSWYGRPGQHWEDKQKQPKRALERAEDGELLTRHEMQAACPDLLVTNYSMLEYMLLRPIERSLFDETRAYFAQNPDEKFIFVLDEAHLYRGANGTEVAYLIRRFLDRLNLPLSRVVFILTSASFSAPDAAKRFAAQLTGLQVGAVTVLTGRKHLEQDAATGDAAVAAVLARTPIAALSNVDAQARAELLTPLLAWRPLEEPGSLSLERASGAARSVQVTGLDPAGQPLLETVALTGAAAVETAQAFAVVTGVVPDVGTVKISRPGLVLGQAGSTSIRWDHDDLARAAWLALRDLPLVAELKNMTSGAAAEAEPGRIAGAAKSLPDLAAHLFGPHEALSLAATDALLELASFARPANGKAPLLPARVHLMFRGLPGLWACVDPQCSALPEGLRGGPTGALYAEPRRHCACQAQVLELWSCRACGIAVANAFAGSPAGPQHLWPDNGSGYSDDTDAVRQTYVCLEDPGPAAATPLLAADLDVLTGRLDGEGARTRPVWMDRFAQGPLAACPRCGARDQISDLQTKGEEPFQQLVAVQVLGQPPRPDSNAPLKGRKTLVFSDGRQTASRLAGLLTTFAFRDSVRPLLLDGFALLTRSRYAPSLDDAPLAVSLSAACNGARLRPEDDAMGDYARWGEDAHGLLQDPTFDISEMSDLSRNTSDATRVAVFEALYSILQDRHTGLNALGLAAVGPKLGKADQDRVDAIPLPTIPGHEAADVRDAMLRLWLWCALDRKAIKLSGTPADVNIKGWTGKLGKNVTHALTAAGHRAWLPRFEREGVPVLRRVFGLTTDAALHITARKIALRPGEAVTWRRCGTCTLVSPDNLLLGEHCPACRGVTEVINPRNHAVFRSRKAFFRRASERLAEHEPGAIPHQLVAKEHSAQLNDASAAKAMSRNEAYELRFQDVPIGQGGQVSDPIDVLSCTTTMEVGIDIGGLTAVALRNVPPGRANYQQRAGRAGRRGAGLSTVVMFCGADSHDQSFFRDPGPIVAGPAPDPVLNLDNRVIAERQAYAFLLGRFQQARVVASSNPNIFESLGDTHVFLTDDASGFSLAGLRAWIDQHRATLIADLGRVFAACPDLDPDALLIRWPDLLQETLGQALAEAAPGGASSAATVPAASPTALDVDDPQRLDDALIDDAEADDDEAIFDDAAFDEVPGEADDPNTASSGAGSGKLLDQLFALGLMPRYAFPTDVATFAVFEEDTDPYRPRLAYSPQQALNAALAQYAPGRSVWIDGKTYMSMAVWSAFDDQRWAAYNARKLYFHCQVCDFATLKARTDGQPETFIDCPACNTPSGMGPAQQWLRPVGFAHPFGVPASPAKIDGEVISRPTRAKLDAPHFDDALRVGGETFATGAGWEAWRENRDLVVTNRGTQSSDRQGFLHCRKCGRTEPADLDPGLAQLRLNATGHSRPRPAKPKEPEACDGKPTRLVLGNQFRTDIAVLRLQLPPNWDFRPNTPATTIAAKSAVEALIQAASQDLEPGDIDGDYRFAPGQADGGLLDLYIYDQAAGGAGFVKAAAADPQLLVRRALQVLDDCTCEDSCYQCLRTYRNRFDHRHLDRRLGADLLRACVQGCDPVVPPDWSQAALRRLHEDITDAGGDFALHPHGLLSPAGRAIVVAHPFSPELPGDPAGAAFAAAATTNRAIDVLMIDRALPLATSLALDVTKVATPPPPPADDGPRLFAVEQAIAGLDSATGPSVFVGAFEPGDFVMTLDAHTLDGPLGDGQAPVVKGTYCLFRPIAAGAAIDQRQVYLLKRIDGATFGATHRAWTVGQLQSVLNAERVRYRASPERTECASERLETGSAIPVAQFIRQVT